MAKILVTGATGALGRQTLEFLLSRVPASDVAALARDPQKLEDLAQRGVDVRRGDYLDQASLERAFAGIDRLMFISTVMFTDVMAQHRNIIAAAQAAGVKHIVYTAIQRREGSDFKISQVSDMDAQTEAALAAVNVDVTIVRNAMYMDMLPSILCVDASKRIRVPTCDTPAAFVSRRDLGEANAVILTTEGHGGRTYTFSGGVAVSMTDIAKILSTAPGQPVQFEDVSVDEFVTERVAAGLPEPVAVFLSNWFQAIAVGEFADVSGDLAQVLGRPPVTPQEFLPTAFLEAKVG
jgi:NAD(P)H dehydrogenase (quinone)